MFSCKRSLKYSRLFDPKSQAFLKNKEAGLKKMYNFKLKDKMNSGAIIGDKMKTDLN